MIKKRVSAMLENSLHDNLNIFQWYIIMFRKVKYKCIRSLQEDTIKISLKDRESTTINDVMIVKNGSRENSMQLYNTHTEPILW